MAFHWWANSGPELYANWVHTSIIHTLWYLFRIAMMQWPELWWTNSHIIVIVGSSGMSSKDPRVMASMPDQLRTSSTGYNLMNLEIWYIMSDKLWAWSSDLSSNDQGDMIYTGWERKVHVTPSVDLYSGQILVFSMTLITVCVLSSV